MLLQNNGRLDTEKIPFFIHFFYFETTFLTFVHNCIERNTKKNYYFILLFFWLNRWRFGFKTIDTNVNGKLKRKRWLNKINIIRYVTQFFCLFYWFFHIFVLSHWERKILKENMNAYNSHSRSIQFDRTSLKYPNWCL